MEKSVVITRKIEIYPFEGSKENNTAVWQKLRAWQTDVRTAANLISSQMYTLDRLKDYFFLVEEIKIKLADRAKDPDGILTTSYQNTAYQVLSAKFKGDVPMAIMSSLSNSIVQVYKTEKPDLAAGRKSLRSYRNTLPIPMPAASFRNWTLQEARNNNYTFELFGMTFMTKFGRDRSNNRIMLSRALDKVYKFCDSSLKLDGNRMFLLLVLRIPSEQIELSDDRIVYAELSHIAPITAKFDQESIEIGTAEDFLYKRRAIQAGLRRAQIAAAENVGGKGRKHKLKSINRFEKAELNYVTDKLHKYSRQLIDFCLDRGAKQLVLLEQKKKEKAAKDAAADGEPLVFRNWSYRGLLDKLKYKAAQKGIDVLIE
nr:hypothetical protein [uncultured Arsenicibacter sp.]